MQEIFLPAIVGDFRSMLCEVEPTKNGSSDDRNGGAMAVVHTDNTCTLYINSKSCLAHDKFNPLCFLLYAWLLFFSKTKHDLHRPLFSLSSGRTFNVRFIHEKITRVKNLIMVVGADSVSHLRFQIFRRSSELFIAAVNRFKSFRKRTTKASNQFFETMYQKCA